ncbi:MAG: TrmH family RNA methyltransferase [Solirubrobacteraceae bacterium]|nr:TrmH family RNA methyltransferase [Solirubrobacteraceae bacterium]
MSALLEEVRRARREPELAVLEGFHAVKHAIRFGAEIERMVCADHAEVAELAAALAPDVAERVAAAEEIGEDPTVVPAAGRIVAIARRPVVDVAAVLADPAPRRVVLLEEPRRLGNIGACVRVAAAADAAAVLTTGPADPWHPDALRGAAGLHFALPVARIDDLPVSDRPLLAIDPDGAPLGDAPLPARAVLAFGTERHGLTGALLARADARVSIPMREGVSSLNLATAVAVTLYA